MFLKIFKYDFNSIFFKVLPFIIILPAISVVVRLFNYIPELIEYNNIITAGIVLFNSVFVLLMVVTSIFNYIICLVRYTKSLFKDEGYLTHTLPVSKHQLLLSQLVANLIMTSLTILVIFLSVLIAYFDPSTIKIIIIQLQESFQVIITDAQFLSTTILLVVTTLISSICSLLLMYLGIAIGHSFSKNKNLYSILFIIVLSYGFSFVLQIVNTIVGFSIMSEISAYNAININLVIILILSVIAGVAAYFANIYFMTKKLNLE